MSGIASPVQPTGGRPADDAGPAEPGFTIGAEHSWHLLASTRVARIAFIDNDLPQLVVMNHVPDGHDLLFQTNEDSRLAQLTASGASLPAVVEVDSVSTDTKSGWSVVAAGAISRTSAAGLDDLPIPWRAEAVGVFLRMSTDHVTGRHVAGPEQI
jgi:hypothetical protein